MNTKVKQAIAAIEPQDWWYASSGPVSTMRGHMTDAPQGMMCCKHEDQPAVKRVQGETDSFGAEYFGACQVCVDELNKDDGTFAGTCEWCGSDSDKLRETRDYEEGTHGPVYDVCPACRKKQNDDAHAELEASGYYDNVHDRCDDEGDDDLRFGEEPPETDTTPTHSKIHTWPMPKK